MADSWAKVEYDFLTGAKFGALPLGCRWLYISLWSYANKERRQIIRRPTNKWCAQHFGLDRHPIGDYLQQLDDETLIILTDTTIEMLGLRDKHGLYKYKDDPLAEASKYREEKPKEVPPPLPRDKNKKAPTKKSAAEKSTGTKKKPSPKKKKPASKDAKHETAGTKAKRLLDYFYDEYLKKKGTKYRGAWDRDMNILKMLIGQDDESTIKRAIDVFLSLNGDRFLQENGYSIPAFKSRFQGILLTLADKAKDKRAPVSKPERLKGTE